MIEDLLRPVRKRTGALIRLLPGGAPLLGLKPRHSPARQLCDMVAATPDDALVKERLRHFANLTPPSLLASIYAEMRDRSAGARLARIERLAPLWHPVLAQPQPTYRRHQLTSHADLFESPRPAQGALICFPDYWEQMFMPCTQFLMKIGAPEMPPVHIVVVRAERLGGFGRGVPGLGASLGAAVGALRDALTARGIGTRAYLGASVGGFFALRAALHDPGCTAVSLAGRFYRMAGAVPLDNVGSGFDPLLCSAMGAPSPLHCVFGRETEIDRAHAERLKSIRPAVCLHPLNGNHYHDPLAMLSARRQLTPVLARLAALTGPAPQPFSIP